MTRQLITRPGALQAPQLDYFLLDGSGSMMPKWTNTLASLAAFRDVMMAAHAHSHAVLQVFDSGELSRIERDALLAAWPSYANAFIRCPGGGTPLYDAINYMARSLRELDPPKASIVIITDGYENGSRYTQLAQAEALLNWCRAKGWQVTFLGCDFNNARQAKALGARPENSIGVRAELMEEAGKLLGQRRLRHMRTDEDINFTDEEKRDFGGYLTGPST